MVPQYNEGSKFLKILKTVNQKDEKPHTAGLDDTAILHIKIKTTEIPLEKKLNTATPSTPMPSSEYDNICLISAYYKIL